MKKTRGRKSRETVSLKRPHIILILSVYLVLKEKDARNYNFAILPWPETIGRFPILVAATIQAGTPNRQNIVFVIWTFSRIKEIIR
jgi:hypothetical protein